jgi:putative addiction module component (TIGR02574 family)
MSTIFVASLPYSTYSNSDMSVLLEQALKLPVDERRQLADDIYESIETSADAVSLTPEQMAELERRIEDSRLHPDDFYTWEEVRERALARK